MSNLSRESKALLIAARKERFPASGALAAAQGELFEEIERIERGPAPVFLARRTAALVVVLLSLIVASSMAAYSIVSSISHDEEVSPPVAEQGAVHEVPPPPQMEPSWVDAPPPEPEAPEPTERIDDPAPSIGAGSGPRRPRAQSPPSPAPDHPTAQVAPPVDGALIEETRLLRLAQGALRRHEPRQALAHLDEHERRFPAGVLALERTAAGLVARCQLRVTDPLRERAHRFVTRHPGSVHTARVRDACLSTER